MNENNKPLGLPIGSVRSIIALILVASFAIVLGAGALMMFRVGEYDHAMAILALLAVQAAGVSGFYFAVRQPGG